MVPIRRAALIMLIAAVALWGRSFAIFSRGSVTTAAPNSLERVIRDIDRGYKLEVLREVPEPVTALTVTGGQGRKMTGNVFVGTSPIGGVYGFNLITPRTHFALAEGLGDYARLGVCKVDTLTIRDLDRDGTYELLATTSQVEPRGRPRLYVWSLSFPHVLRTMARPDIRSSSSRGIGFLDAPGESSLSTYVTFSDHGEIVEYHLVGGKNESGFAADTLGWKQVGQLPGSGEELQSIDVDQDGQAELCAATGSAPGAAAIHIYTVDRPGRELHRERVIDEAGRFFNVRFLVGDTRGDGSPDLIAWWRREDDRGDAEIIRYRLGPEGIRERSVLARGADELFWPSDGQTAVMDLDGDGHPEVWFANRAGSLWRLDASRAPALKRIVQIKGEFGPITPAPATAVTPPALLVARGRSVLRLVEDSTALPPAPPLALRPR